MLDVIVTGAEGFIGRRVVQRLADRGAAFLPLGRAQGDVATHQFWQSLPPARSVIHLAGRSYVPDSWTETAGFMAANVTGTQHALDWCKRHQARIVLASAYVYGIPDRLPIAETDAVRPNNPYALSKRLAEQLCEFAALHDNTAATVLRLFNVYGSGQREEFLIPTLLSQVLAGKPIKVMSLTPRRDYVAVDDVVDAIVAAMEVPRGYNCVNIGSGQSMSVQDIVDTIQRLCGTSLPIVSPEVARRNEINDVRADIAHAQDILGWQPRVEFEAGMRAMIKELQGD